MLIVLKLIMLAVMIAGPAIIGRELALAARGKERAAAPAAKAESAAEDAA
ncbi:MAG TPA: hypothetical protein VGE07_22215 [Herpetosiphonaceae bacterium]